MKCPECKAEQRSDSDGVCHNCGVVIVPPVELEPDDLRMDWREPKSPVDPSVPE